ncbi:MAG: DUF1460 domain-containing protein [Candidatus Hydrogenedentes bacterium]|nr:DUF1460 domain-containing protein [Candidatus Hydrogenedentota bacterium]
MIVSVLMAALTAGSWTLYDMTPGDIDEYAAQLSAREPDFSARVVAVANRSLGTPYADGPLGEGPAGVYDQDPLVDFQRVDCVTFIEQTIALASARSFDEAVDMLQRIRYKDGAIAFETRNHFMIADWIENNPFCRDVTAEAGVPCAEVSRRISKRDFFERVNAPELGRFALSRIVDLRYIPAAQAGEAAPNLPSPAVVVFVGKVDWLFALHCGLFIRTDADEGPQNMLYHASSKAGCVVAEDFAGYLSGTERYLGFTAYAIDNPAGRGAPSRDGEDSPE